MGGRIEARQGGQDIVRGKERGQIVGGGGGGKGRGGKGGTPNRAGKCKEGSGWRRLRRHQ